jgi:ketose-bisphosphate aldolase
MPLMNMKPMLLEARAGGYAVAAFNIIDYTTCWAVAAAADELNSPVIIQVSVKTIKLFGHKPIGQWVRGLAEQVKVPIALHLDHCKDLDVIKGCIAHGWTSVMFDGSEWGFDENLAKTREAYLLANAGGVGLEAEIGAIGGVEDDIDVADEDAHLADVEECVRFCKALPGLAVFAPAIGTAHGIYKGEPKIAFERMAAISKGIDAPLALHGGTGLSDEVFHKSIARGCAKINISTHLKHTYIDTFIASFNGKAGYEPIKIVQDQFAAMKKDVAHFLKLFGSVGKAAALAGKA